MLGFPHYLNVLAFHILGNPGTANMLKILTNTLQTIICDWRGRSTFRYMLQSDAGIAFLHALQKAIRRLQTSSNGSLRKFMWHPFPFLLNLSHVF